MCPGHPPGMPGWGEDDPGWGKDVFEVDGSRALDLPRYLELLALSSFLPTLATEPHQRLRFRVQTGGVREQEAREIVEVRERETHRPQKHLFPTRDRLPPPRHAWGMPRTHLETCMGVYGRCMIVYAKSVDCYKSTLLNRSIGPYGYICWK